MRGLKRFLGMLLAFCLLCVPLSALAEDETGIEAAEPASWFGAYTGTVTEISKSEAQAFPEGGGPVGWQNWVWLSAESAETGAATIVVTDSTYILDGKGIAVGDVITAYYPANEPMPAIEPPQYTAEIIVVGDYEEFVKVDLFDENLVSADNKLKLNMDESTVITGRNGLLYDGPLEGRKLIVVYDISTRSIPALTTPIRIIVPDAFGASSYLDQIGADTQIVVDVDMVLTAPAPYLSEEGYIMVPLRAVAEALGYTVTWDNALKQVTLDGGVRLRIGSGIYFGAHAVFTDVAPALMDGHTYVPLSFFKQVLGMNNAYFFENTIVINNGELMS